METQNGVIDLSDEKEVGLKRKTEMEGNDVKLKTFGAYARYLGLLVFFILSGVTNMNAFGLLGFGNTASWKEEVLLHDGSKIIVKRWQKHGGDHEIGQEPGIAEQSVTFTLPGTKKTIQWKDEYSPELGRCNFIVVALHILNDTPYLIAKPRLDRSYNKWGRPNPPYVIFKFEGNVWKRITISELPMQFKNINLVITPDADEEKLVRQRVVSSEMVINLNSSLKRAEYKTILRAPLQNINVPTLVPTEDGGWIGIDWFTSQPNYEACIKFSKGEKSKPDTAPAMRYLKEVNRDGNRY